MSYKSKQCIICSKKKFSKRFEYFKPPKLEIKFNIGKQKYTDIIMNVIIVDIGMEN